MINPDNGRTYKAHVSRIKRAKLPDRWAPKPSSTDSSNAENEFKPFNFKQDYFENISDEEN